MIRVLSIMESDFVSGPAKNLLEFAKRARNPSNGLPSVELTAATYQRGNGNPADNGFVAAAARAGVTMDIIPEKRRFDTSVISHIESILELRKPDIVQTHNVKSHFLMRWSGLWRKYRWIAYHHGYVTTDTKMLLYNQLDRWSLQKPAHLVTVCGPFREQLESRGIPSNRITVRHNAIKPFVTPPAEDVDAVRRSIPCPVSTPLMLMVSRLSHEKGHVDLLEALAILKRSGTRRHTVIVGEGYERGAIERARERLGLQDDVTLAGHKDDVRPYFAIANLYLMPSHSEGSPNSLLEAMAAGVPCVASSVGGVPEIMTNERTGLLTPPSNPEALAKAIGRLLTDPALAASLADNARIEIARFTPEVHHANLVRVYQQVLGSPAGSASRRQSAESA
jgi:glycosyltransferase involved in cell wall biosynthesis